MASRESLSFFCFLFSHGKNAKLAKKLRAFGVRAVSREGLGTPLGQQKRRRGVLQGTRGEDEENREHKPLLLPVGHAPRRLLGRARRLEPLVLLAARATLGVVRREPRVFGGDLGVDAGERRAELVPVRLQRDDLVDEALASLRS